MRLQRTESGQVLVNDPVEEAKYGVAKSVKKGDLVAVFTDDSEFLNLTTTC